MTPFEHEVTSQLREVGQSVGLDLKFEQSGAYVCASFTWKETNSIVLVCDGNLIFELDAGEEYFETPEDPRHHKVRQLVEYFRLRLEGLHPRAARKQSEAVVGEAS